MNALVKKNLIRKYITRSIHQKCSIKKGVIRNFVKFTGKHMCQSIFFNKVAALRYATLLKKRLWDMCFLVNIAKFLRTLFYRIRLGDCFCISNKVLCFHERYVICLYKELRMMEMLLMTSIVITYFLVLIFNFFLRQ